MLSLLSVSIVLFVSTPSSSPSTPGTALSAEVLNDFQSLRMAVQAAPSVVCLASRLVSGRTPSDPVPPASPAAVRPFSKPRLLRASESLQCTVEILLNMNEFLRSQNFQLFFRLLFVAGTPALLLRLALVHDIHHGSLGLLTGAEA